MISCYSFLRSIRTTSYELDKLYLDGMVLCETPVLGLVAYMTRLS
jgi:hypothetical protein